MGSQNRKKKLALRAKKIRTEQHKANRAHKLTRPTIDEMRSFMENLVPDCVECGSERERVEIDQLPPDKLAFWKSRPDFASYRYFVHCCHCGTYNPLGEMGGSWGS